tara:strand:- start:53 stop:307 length:255 start_codon:yes stop_codon:yes gene_type:complete
MTYDTKSKTFDKLKNAVVAYDVEHGTDCLILIDFAEDNAVDCMAEGNYKYNSEAYYDTALRSIEGTKEWDQLTEACKELFELYL